MKTIIAGSRSITAYEVVERAIEYSRFNVSIVISGTANGVDRLGEKYAGLHNIPIERFPADWNKYGKSAGYIRNKKMAEKADALIAVWDGESKGTLNMINIAKEKKLKIFVYKI